MPERVQWKEARSLIKPIFARAEIGNMAMMAKHVDRLIALLSRDSRTFDIRPMLKKLVYKITWHQFVFVWQSCSWSFHWVPLRRVCGCSDSGRCSGSRAIPLFSRWVFAGLGQASPSRPSVMSLHVRQDLTWGIQATVYVHRCPCLPRSQPYVRRHWREIFLIFCRSNSQIYPSLQTCQTSPRPGRPAFRVN